jgi:hypothetical protein
MLNNMGISQSSPTHVFCNKKLAIRNVTRGCTSRKTWHIWLKYHLSRDLASKGVIRMVYVSTYDKCADLLSLCRFPHYSIAFWRRSRIFSQPFFWFFLACYRYIMVEWGCWSAPICIDASSTFLHHTRTDNSITYDIWLSYVICQWYEQSLPKTVLLWVEPTPLVVELFVAACPFMLPLDYL